MHTELSKQLTELIPRLRRFASGLAGSIDRGDELVQAACERLMGHHDRLSPDTRLESWFYRVIRNLHIDAIRAQSVRDRGAHQMRLIGESQPNSFHGLEDHLHLHEVNQAMQALPEEQRSALLLVCVEGFSYREAAEMLEVPMGTVTSRLVRGRKALIAMLEHESTKLELEVAGE